MDNSSLKQVPDSTDKKDTNYNSLAQWLMWKESIPAGSGCVKRKNNSVSNNQSYEHCLAIACHSIACILLVFYVSYSICHVATDMQPGNKSSWKYKLMDAIRVCWSVQQLNKVWTEEASISGNTTKQLPVGRNTQGDSKGKSLGCWFVLGSDPLTTVLLECTHTWVLEETPWC